MMTAADVGLGLHRQVRASNGVEVDEGIRDLLEALWASGMDTEFSCQRYGAFRPHGHPDWAYIKFSRQPDATLFCSSLAEFNRDGHIVDFPAAHIPELTELWQNSGQHSIIGQ